MLQALLAAGPPIIVYVAFWFYIRAGNRQVAPEARRTIALFASGLFLIVPPFVPPIFDGGSSSEIMKFMIGVCGVCALSMAITARRTVPSRAFAPNVLIILSAAVASLTFLHYLWDF